MNINAAPTIRSGECESGEENKATIGERARMQIRRFANDNNEMTIMMGGMLGTCSLNFNVAYTDAFAT